jgi:anti-anti-sigma factor
MQVLFEKEPGCTVVTVDGDLSIPNLDKFRDHILDHIKNGTIKFLFDFGSVTYIDSSGISMLLMLLQSARKAGGDIRLSNINSLVKDALLQVGLNHLFMHYNTRETGVASFSLI